MDVVDAIAEAPTRMGGGGERSTPVEPARIKSVEVSEKVRT
jgi:hypothetical protein